MQILPTIVEKTYQLARAWKQKEVVSKAYWLAEAWTECRSSIVWKEFISTVYRLAEAWDI